MSEAKWQNCHKRRKNKVGCIKLSEDVNPDENSRTD